MRRIILENMECILFPSKNTKNVLNFKNKRLQRSKILLGEFEKKFSGEIVWSNEKIFYVDENRSLSFYLKII